jgi:predicted nucleic acid-binding protein
MSVVVVSDTTALNYLVLLGIVEVLPRLFGSIHVPPEVIAELCHDAAPRIVRDFALSPPEWLQVHPAQCVDPSSKLDIGESAAIALAEELRADFVLIDERDGREAAKQKGLKVIGLLNVLDQADEAELIDLRSALSDLQRTTFHVSEGLLRVLLLRSEQRK